MLAVYESQAKQPNTHGSQQTAQAHILKAQQIQTSTHPKVHTADDMIRMQRLHESARLSMPARKQQASNRQCSKRRCKPAQAPTRSIPHEGSPPAVKAMYTRHLSIAPSAPSSSNKCARCALVTLRSLRAFFGRPAFLSSVITAILRRAVLRFALVMLAAASACKCERATNIVAGTATDTLRYAVLRCALAPHGACTLYEHTDTTPCRCLQGQPHAQQSVLPKQQHRYAP
jgi:hypothetical protein